MPTESQRKSLNIPGWATVHHPGQRASGTFH